MSLEATMQNKNSWDLRTSVHFNSNFYDVSGFLKGKCTLNQLERDLIPNLLGKRLLHLQCHFGLDTLSWSRLGAITTGVDFSKCAIKMAKKLSEITKIPARFIEADVQNLKPWITPCTYDVAITSYGVLCWIADLKSWACSIEHALNKGGRFILVEFHPILEVFYPGKISGSLRYFPNNQTVATRTQGTYTDPNASIEYIEYRWQHSISEIITALMNVGLSLVDFKEYPFSPYKVFPDLDSQVNGYWISSKNKDRIPYLYSVIVEK